MSMWGEDEDYETAQARIDAKAAAEWNRRAQALIARTEKTGIIAHEDREELAQLLWEACLPLAGRTNQDEAFPALRELMDGGGDAPEAMMRFQMTGVTLPTGLVSLALHAMMNGARRQPAQTARVYHIRKADELRARNGSLSARRAADLIARTDPYGKSARTIRENIRHLFE